MGINILGADGNTVEEIDQGHGAARVSLRPSAVLAWTSLGLQTGILPTGTVSGAILFALRNTGPNLLLVRRLQVGFAINTAFTAAQRLEFGLALARGWTAFEAGGNPVTVSGGRHKQSLGAINAEARIATTTVLTAGSGRTVDAQNLAVVAGGVGAVGTSIPLTPLISHDAGDYPVVLAANEGLLLTNGVLFGAGGAGVVYVNLEVAEMTIQKWVGT